MRNILVSFFIGMVIGGMGVGLYTMTASAKHNGVPTVGQERIEETWSCITIDDAKLFVTARAKALGYFAWIELLREMVNQNLCQMADTTYIVEEIVETVSGLEILNRKFGEPITHYIIKSGDHFIVTY